MLLYSLVSYNYAGCLRKSLKLLKYCSDFKKQTEGRTISLRRYHYLIFMYLDTNGSSLLLPLIHHITHLLILLQTYETRRENPPLYSFPRKGGIQCFRFGCW